MQASFPRLLQLVASEAFSITASLLWHQGGEAPGCMINLLSSGTGHGRGNDAVGQQEHLPAEQFRPFTSTGADPSVVHPYVLPGAKKPIF